MPKDLGTDWPPIQFTIAADGSRVSYRHFEGTGTPFVNVRSAGTPSMALLPEIWQRAWMDRFRAGRNLLFFDWRGSGQSDPLDGDLSIEQLVLDLDAVIDVAGRPVDAIIHGRASFAVCSHAARHPDRFRSLTFSAGILRPDDSSYGFYSRPGWESHYSELLRSFAKHYYWLDAEATTRFSLRWASAVPATSYAAYLASEQGFDLTEILPKIALPTWVMAHQPLDHEAARNVALLLPDSHLSIYPETAGSPPLGGWSRGEWDAHLGARLGEEPSIRPQDGGDQEVTDRITDREREVLAEVATGATNKQIAATLGLSHWTIQRHVSNLLRKTGLKNRRQLMRIEGELEPD